MRLGIIAPTCGQGTNAAALRAAATAAEQVGYSSVWVTDGLFGLDPVAALAASAATTSHLRLGASVLVAPRYDPVLLARALTSLDAVSDGRLTVALGLGPHEPARAGSRGGRLEALLDVLEARWHRGPENQRPVQRPNPPVLLAGSSPAALDRVARRGDGWHPAGIPLAELAPRWAEVRARAEGYGRSADALQLVVRADLTVTATDAGGDRPPYCGTIEQIAADVAATRRAGAHEVVLSTCAGAGFDESLDVYARVAEAVGVADGHRSMP